jgi:2-desacetyl-2-hydroxyethyl bacteriochlorophyllide A dehydrogenase
LSTSKLSALRGKRVVFRDRGLVEIEDFNVVEPGSKQLLIESVCTLISPGTETAFLMALPNTPGKFPMYPGYSNAGVVYAKGGEVSAFNVGDRVVSRKPHASHVIAEEGEAEKIPENVSLEEASFSTLATIAMQGVRKAGIELGESVLVLGQGLVGNLALQLSKLSGGMPVIGVDMYDYRLDVAKKCGADEALNPTKVDLKDAVMKITERKGADVVIEATGNPNVISLALDLARPRGRVILLGSPRGISTVNFYSLVHVKGVIVIGAHNNVRPIYESSRRFWTYRDEVRLVLNLLGKKLLKVKDLVTERLRFEEAAEAYNKLINAKENILGIILKWKENED